MPGTPSGEGGPKVPPSVTPGNTSESQQLLKYQVEQVQKAEYPDVVRLWEASVRATHAFLKEEDIEYFKPLILNRYLGAVVLRCIRNPRKAIIGFAGFEGHHLEMLFIHPDYRGKGIGKALLDYGIAQLQVRKVDVNEQNLQAVGFYQHCGFTIIGRSERDASGKPYPILHMALEA